MGQIQTEIHLLRLNNENSRAMLVFHARERQSAETRIYMMQTRIESLEAENRSLLKKLGNIGIEVQRWWPAKER